MTARPAVSFVGIRLKNEFELCHLLPIEQKTNKSRQKRRRTSTPNPDVACDVVDVPDEPSSAAAAPPVVVVTVRLVELQRRRCQQRRFELSCAAECIGQRLYDLVGAWCGITNIALYSLSAERPSVVERVLRAEDAVLHGSVYLCNGFADRAQEWAAVEIVGVAATGRTLRGFLPVVLPLAAETAHELLRLVAAAVCRTHESASFLQKQLLCAVSTVGGAEALVPLSSDSPLSQPSTTGAELRRFVVAYVVPRVGDAVGVALQPRHGAKVVHKGVVVSHVYLLNGQLALDATCGNAAVLTGLMCPDLAYLLLIPIEESCMFKFRFVVLIF
jgi:hypothetical protein